MLKCNFMQAKKIQGWVVFFLLLASCTSYRKISYLQTLKDEDTLFVNSYHRYRVQPGDQLYITFKTLDPEINKILNNESVLSSTTLYLNANFYLISYTINKEGYISLPLLGDIYVKDFPVDTIRHIITAEALKYVKDVFVEVKLVSYKISVLGEVKMPGQQVIMNDKTSIFEVIARAGDMNYFANRKKVTILRESDKGIVVKRLDLTRKDVLMNEDYYVCPNDIVYVEPRRGAAFRIGVSDYSVIIGTLLSTATLLLLIFNTLKP